jgi:urease accessory protein
MQTIFHLSFVVLLLLSPGVAQAHTGFGVAFGLSHGFAHPFSGVDHLLAMIGVGVLAARVGGRALWLVPASFLVVMACGGAIGASGVQLPFVEMTIALSLVVLGVAIFTRVAMPTGVAMGLVGLIAVLHGHAHGAEMPASASGLAYAAGFLLATASLHVAGVALGLGFGRVQRVPRETFIRTGGA